MLTIIVKGTNGCNLACSYCSLGEKKNFKFVDSTTLLDIMTFACNYAKHREEKNVNFILHGGEPTLIKPEIYDVCISSVIEAFPDMEISISMQSNGLEISDEFLKLIKKYDICMGISIDGSKTIHDSERQTINKSDTYEVITNNIDRLLKEKISVSCLMVLTKNALKEDLKYLDFFEKRNIHLKINPLLNYGEVGKHPELVLEEGDYASYIIRTYEEIIEKNINVMVSPIDKIISCIIHKQTISECSYNKDCNKHFLCIDYKRNIYPCGKFSDMDELCIGNINAISYADIDNIVMKSLYERRSSKLPNKCKECKYLRLCNGGCSAEAMIDGNINEVPILCSDNRMIFDYFYGDGLRLLKNTLTKNKRILEEQV